ncbi:MAG: Tm-1-like ATP-binding domain-containing protein [Planctomyces sp.]
MVNFGAPETIPQKYVGRRFYVHNPQVTVLLPLRGISVISAAGGPFHDAEADAILFAALCNGLRPGVRVRDVDTEINSPEFAAACAEELLRNMQAARGVV